MLQRIQDGKSKTHFMPTSGRGELLILMIWRLLGWFPGCFWLLQMIPPSAFYGESSASAGYSTPSPLCGVHPLWWSQRFFVDACIWDDFLVTSAVLELSTLASLLFCYDSENASFASRLSDRGCWGKPKCAYISPNIFSGNGDTNETTNKRSNNLKIENSIFGEKI